MLELTENIPGVYLIVDKDSSGYNLQINLVNLEFAPENVNKEYVAGEGHAHLYINDKKITRVYSEWYNLPADWLNEGENTIEVTLSSNDHQEYYSNSKIISAKETIVK